MRAPDFWERESWPSRLLAPLGGLYNAAGVIRRAYTRPYDPGIPVICVGNLVAGGAGKTPVALSLLARLPKAHALTRGYKGSLSGPLQVDRDRHDSGQVGDEALLLAAAAPTWLSADRAAGARAAAAAGAQALVMDDGLQNPGLAKTWSLMVVDGGYGFGNGRVIPAGPLRQPVDSGLALADAVVLLGEDRTGVLARIAGRRPVLRGRLVPDPVAAAGLAGKPVLAFAGIGRPEKFFETLAGIGCQLVETRSFPDHYPYGADEIRDLVRQARAADCLAVTTEKDAVRLPPSCRGDVMILKVTVAWDQELPLPYSSLP